MDASVWDGLGTESYLLQQTQSSSNECYNGVLYMVKIKDEVNLAL